MLDRDEIEAIFAKLCELMNGDDRDAFVELFHEDCSFMNSALSEPVKGKENLRAVARHWPNVTNRPEWMVIDGNRLCFGWNERQEGMPATAPSYRGFSTYVFDENGLVTEYEGIFDMLAVAAAMGRPG